MKRPVNRVLCTCAFCVVGLFATASFVNSQSTGSPPSTQPDRLALQDSNQAPPSSPQPDTSVPPPAGAASDKVVELTRGPINQGFAEMTNMTPQPSPPVAKQPPAPIDEEPPDARPDNPESTWVPGYWSWDADSNDHIWVSGSWRVPPPGHRWIPGYWSENDGNYQWVSGFWTPEEAEQVTYLPAPPPYRDEDVDVSSPPDADHFWVPGYWSYGTNAYEWQPGYWSRVVADWMWIPAHYEWTPNGYVLIAGHWDYPLAQRGILFTPVSFLAPIYLNRAFVYTPQYLVSLDNLVENLFVAPGFQSYFFGDYYGPQYARFGIYPWFNVGVGPYLYDPIFAYRSSLLWRKNPHWRDDFRRRYDRLVRDPALRPPRTWRDYERLVRSGRQIDRDRVIAMPLGDALRDQRFNQHIVRMSDADRRALRERSNFHRNLATERSRLERANIQKQIERRPGERVPERPGVRPGERPIERPTERPARPGERPPERPAMRPEPRREGTGVAEGPRTLRLPTRGPQGEPGRAAPRVEERREAPRTPNVRPAERPARVNTPRPPQPDRAVRAPAARPAPAREKK
jgi:WXXGXW repeat (2 copies)